VRALGGGRCGPVADHARLRYRCPRRTFCTPQLTRALDSQLVVVDFTATWCGPCQKIAPKFAEMADVNTDCVFIKVDVDENEVRPHPACLLLCLLAAVRLFTERGAINVARHTARLLRHQLNEFVSSGAALGRLGFRGWGAYACAARWLCRRRQPPAVSSACPPSSSSRTAKR
jgi:thiol-disulfide isomerase/thioredoxin